MNRVPASARTAGAHTYRGRTVEELLPRIQRELGDDAIIVRRREGLTGGVAGFFQRPFVELEATEGGPRVDVYDEDGVAPVAPLASERPADALEHEPGYWIEHESGHGVNYDLGHRVEYEPGHASEHWAEPAPPSEHRPFYEREPPRLRPDGAYVTERLAELARSGRPAPARTVAFEPARSIAFEPTRSSGFEQTRSSAFESTPPSVFAPTQSSEFEPGARASVALAPGSLDEPDPFAVVLERAEWSPPPKAARPRTARPATRSHARARANIQSALLALGVSERFAGELIDAAAAHILPLAPRAGLSEAVRVALAQRIPVAPPLPSKGAAIVVVGPGGSGKTSCCAALLGAYRKGSSLPASCATVVRGAPGGEMRMLLSPHVMKLTPIDTRRSIGALRKTRSEGLLVVDTPALSRGERAGMRGLAALLGELKPERVAIALPATLGAAASAQMLEALRPLGANALAVTHADETDQIGVAVEAACTFGLAPEYTLNRARSGGWRLGRLDPAGLAATLLR